MLLIASTFANWKHISLFLLLMPPGIAVAEPPEDREASFARWVDTRRMKFQHQYEDRLKQLGLATKDSIPLFVSRSIAEDVNVRRAAVLALRLVGHEDPDAAIPALTRAATDNDERVRGTAVAGLGEIGPRAATAVSVIVEMLENDEPNSTIAACALAQFGVKAKPAVSSLAKTLTHKSSFTRESAANALGSIGPEARAAAPALRAAWRDDDSSVRLEAAYAAWKIEKSDDAIKVLIQLLESKEPLVCLRTIEALGDIGPPAKVALPALEKIHRQLQAKKAPAVDNGVDGLDDLFAGTGVADHANPFDSINAVAAVWAIGRIRETEDLLEQLLRELENKAPMARIGAAWALGKIGPDARIAIPRLRKMCEDPVYGYALLYVARALQQIEPTKATVSAQ